MKPYMYDIGKTKVLVDGKRVDGFNEDGVKIDEDGITINFIIKADFLKNLHAKDIKIIYMDADVTAVTKMKVDKLEMLPRTITGKEFPLVPIKFSGEPKTKYTD